MAQAQKIYNSNCEIIMLRIKKKGNGIGHLKLEYIIIIIAFIKPKVKVILIKLLKICQ